MRMLLAGLCVLALAGCGRAEAPEQRPAGAGAAGYRTVGGLQLADRYLVADVHAFAYRYADAGSDGDPDADAYGYAPAAAGADADADGCGGSGADADARF